MMIQTSELKKLEEVYGQSGNQIVLLYGRDNCQKEQLIKEFCKEKKFFYYRARQASEREQVLQMGQEVHFTSQRMIFPQTLVFRQWKR